MNKNERRVVKFAYLRDERDPRRVMTIARRWGKNGKKMHYAFTICNPVADQFRKATGRELAVQRLEANPWKIRPEQGAFVLRSIVLDIACRSCNIEDQRNAAEMTAQWLDENDRLLEEDFIRITEPEDNDCGSCEERCEGCGCLGMQAFCDRENSFREESCSEERSSCGGCECTASNSICDREGSEAETYSEEFLDNLIERITERADERMLRERAKDLGGGPMSCAVPVEDRHED